MKIMQKNMRFLCFLVITAFNIFTESVLAEKVPADPEKVVSTFVRNNCFECHYGELSEGELNFQELPWRPDSSDVLQRWVKIYDRLEKGEMPPDAEDLSSSQRFEILDVLSGALNQADRDQVRIQGRGPMRRLTRSEYEENLRDFLHLPHLDVKDILPEDPEAHQTNKATAALDITRVQLNAYLDAADVALRAAVSTGVQRRIPTRYYALATKMFPKAVDHAGRESSFYAKNSKMIPLTSSDLKKIRKNNNHDKDVEIAIFRSAGWPYYGYPEDFVTTEAGEYRVRFSARSVRQIKDFRLLPSPNPQPMTFRARKPSLADVTGDVRAVGGIIDVVSEAEIYETTVHLKIGETIEYSLLGLPVPFPITSHGGPLYYDFPTMPEGGHPGIAFRWIEITGPIDSLEWPAKSHKVLFGDLPIREDRGKKSQLRIEVVSEDPKKDAALLLRRFADNVARKPVPSSALQDYTQLIFDQLDEGNSFAEAMLSGYKAFLCSTHFLFLPEPKVPLNQFAIASRLSHFLWNSRPDLVLRDRAEKQQLRNPNILHEETNRLIADARFERFVVNFTDHWLDLNELRRDDPDIRLYPEYRGDDYLIESMERETRAFIATTVRENLPVSTLVDSEFSMINDRLARHYNLPEIKGSAIRKVTLPKWSPRGGLLTQAAVLKITANGSATTPVIRGAWVMDRIFGDPPPSPPLDVPKVESDIRGATTIREVLKKHSSDETCLVCHSRFDPAGFALESFDIFGAWRDRYRSFAKGDEITGIDRAGHKYSYRVATAVDPSGRLPNGKAFQDIQEFKAILKRRSRQIARNMLHRFITYATGTPVRYSDRREIEKILDQCEPNDYRIRDLMHGLIQNRIFIGETVVEKTETKVTPD